MSKSFIVTINIHWPNLIPWVTPTGMVPHSEKQSLLSSIRKSKIQQTMGQGLLLSRNAAVYEVEGFAEIDEDN